jgi:hypothetical protein
VIETLVVPAVLRVTLNVWAALLPAPNVSTPLVTVAPGADQFTVVVDCTWPLGVTVNVDGEPVTPVVGPVKAKLVASAITVTLIGRPARAIVGLTVKSMVFDPAAGHVAVVDALPLPAVIVLVVGTSVAPPVCVHVIVYVCVALIGAPN